MPSCTATFYLSGTTTDAAIYHDGALTNPFTDPVTADATGTFPAIYLDPAVVYRVIIKTSAGVTISDTDPYVPSGIGSAEAIAAILNPQTPQELANGVTPVNFKYLPGNVYRYGNNVNPGVTDMTAAIQAAINSGYAVYAQEDIYLTGSVFFPDREGFVFQGDGPGQTIFLASTANTVIFQKIATTNKLEYADIGHFSIKAHPAGSTGPALKCTGMRACRLSFISGLSNGTLGFYSLLDLAAYPYLCYGITMDNITLAVQAGWTKAIDFNNAGTGNALNNCNVATVRNAWIYANGGLSIGIDAQRSAQVVIEGSLFEGNTGATAINSGNITTIRGNWFELNAADVSYNVSGEGAGNGGIVEGNYFTSNHTIDMLGCVGNVWFNNKFPSGVAFTNYSNYNVIYNAQDTYAPTAPTLAYSSGQTGTLTLTSTTQTIGQDLAQTSTWILKYSWTAAAASTFTKFALTFPTGWVLRSISANYIRGSNGGPEAVGCDDVGNVYVSNLFNDQHGLVLYVDMLGTQV